MKTPLSKAILPLQMSGFSDISVAIDRFLPKNHGYSYLLTSYYFLAILFLANILPERPADFSHF